MDSFQKKVYEQQLLNKINIIKAITPIKQADTDNGIKYKSIGDYEDEIQKAINTCGTILGEDGVNNIEKAMNHKYYKREGTPGNYKYYYTEAEYKKTKGIDHVIDGVGFKDSTNLKAGDLASLADGTRVKIVTKLSDTKYRVRLKNGEERITHSLQALKTNVGEEEFSSKKVGDSSKGKDISNIDEIRSEGVYTLPSGSMLRVFKDNGKFGAEYKYPGDTSDFWGFAKDGEDKFYRTSDIKDLVSRIEDKFKKVGVKANPETNSDKFSKLIEDEDPKFFEAVEAIAPSDDDGESESALLDRLNKLPIKKQQAILDKIKINHA